MEREDIIKQKYELMKCYYDKIDELEVKKNSLVIKLAFRDVKTVEYATEVEYIEKEVRKCKDKIDSIELELRAFGIKF